MYADGLDECSVVLTYIKTLRLPPVDVERPLALILGYFIPNQRDVTAISQTETLYGGWNVT